MNQETRNIVDIVHTLAEKKVTDGRLEDEHGSLVRVDRIKQHDLTRDQLVRQLATDCAVISDELQALKMRLACTIQNFVQQMFEKHGRKLGGKKGNVTLFSFDKSLKVERTQQERETTNEHILVAKQLVDDCLKKWSKGANKNLQGVVQKYFRTDGKGSYSVQDLKKLLRMKIGDDDPQWQAAMKALSDSIEQSHTETYFRVYYRTESGAYKNVPLNITDVH